MKNVRCGEVDDACKIKGRVPRRKLMKHRRYRQQSRISGAQSMLQHLACDAGVAKVKDCFTCGSTLTFNYTQDHSRLRSACMQ